MGKNSGRVVIYPKDVQWLTGKSEKSILMLLKKFKESKEKAAHQFISIEDFAEYTWSFRKSALCMVKVIISLVLF
jgi:hypothetical protein